MRSTPRPADQAIGACGGPARDCRYINEYSGGPFDGEQDFNDFILDLWPSTPSAIKGAIRASLRDDHRIMFSHCDLSPRNIMVSGGHITGLVDWEYSGFYPEHWEYVKFFQCVTDCRDWKSFADVIFDTKYPTELVSHQALVRWHRTREPCLRNYTSSLASAIASTMPLRPSSYCKLPSSCWSRSSLWVRSPSKSDDSTHDPQR